MGKVRRRKRRRRDGKNAVGRQQSPGTHVVDKPENETPVSDNGQRKASVDSGERNGRGDDLRNRSGIEIIPYSKIDGGSFNINDVFMGNVFDLMTREKTFDSLFPRESVKSAAEFLIVMKQPHNLVVLAFDDSEFVGLAWVNAIKEDFCFAHYWFSRKVWGKKSIVLGKTILKYWFCWRTQDDSECLFKVLLGETPATNSRAKAYNRRLGFTELGTVPKIHDGGMSIYYLENPYG